MEDRKTLLLLRHAAQHTELGATLSSLHGCEEIVAVAFSGGSITSSLDLTEGGADLCFAACADLAV